MSFQTAPARAGSFAVVVLSGLLFAIPSIAHAQARGPGVKILAPVVTACAPTALANNCQYPSTLSLTGETVRVEGLAGGQVALETVRVSGALATLTPASEDEARSHGLVGEVSRFVAEVPLREGSHTIEVSARSANGGATTVVLHAIGTLGPDRTGPLVALLAPTRVVVTETAPTVDIGEVATARIEGVAQDVSGVADVVVGTGSVALEPMDAAAIAALDLGFREGPGVRFVAEVPVSALRMSVPILATDATGNRSHRQIAIRRVVDPTPGRPNIVVITPLPDTSDVITWWNESATRVRVQFAAFEPFGRIASVTADGERLYSLPRQEAGPVLRALELPEEAQLYRVERELEAYGDHPLVLEARGSNAVETRRLTLRRPQPDAAAPVVELLAPAVHEGRRLVDTDAVAVSGWIHDPSGIVTTSVNGAPAGMRAATEDELRDLRLQPGTMMFEATVRVTSGTNPIVVSASDHAGNVVNHRDDVVRVEPYDMPGYDQEPPVIAITEPRPQATRGIAVVERVVADTTDAALQGTTMSVRGTVDDLTGVVSVLVNGDTASLGEAVPAGELLRSSFSIEISLAPGDNDIRIEATDAKGNVGTATQTVRYAVRAFAPTPVAAAAGESELPRVHVMSVGVSDYADERVPDLRFADDDASSFFQQVSDGAIVPAARRLMVDTQVTRPEFMRELSYMLQNSRPGDLVMLFMAMHGLEDPNGSGVYFLPADAELSNLAGTAIARDDIMRLLAQAGDRKVMLFIDACHSGHMQAASTGQVGMRATAADVNNFVREIGLVRSGVLVFNSASAYEVSRESEEWGGGHGVFTYYILEGLAGAADENGNGMVTVDELEMYVKSNVRSATNYEQNPMLSGVGDMRMPLSLVD